MLSSRSLARSLVPPHFAAEWTDATYLIVMRLTGEIEAVKIFEHGSHEYGAPRIDGLKVRCAEGGRAPRRNAGVGIAHPSPRCKGTVTRCVWGRAMRHVWDRATRQA